MPLNVVIDLKGKKHIGEIVHVYGQGIHGYILFKENGKVVKLRGYIANGI